MFGQRSPLAVAAASVATLLAATLALSGCSAAPDPAALGLPITGGADPVVAVIGDSIESGLGLQPYQAWPALVAVDRRWALTNLSVRGAGFLAKGDGDEDFDAQIDRAMAAHPDLVLVGASDNDLGHDDVQVASAIMTAVGHLHSALPDARIVGFSSLTGAADLSTLARFDDALESAVTDADGLWLDLGQPYRNRSGLVQDDGEHPTAAGQRAIAAAVLAGLDRAEGDGTGPDPSASPTAH